MADEVTRLSLAVDSSQVTRAHAELDKFAASGKKAETAAQGLEAGSKGVGNAMAGIATGAQKANAAQATLGANASSAADAFSKQAVASLRVEAAQASLAASTSKVALAQENYNRIAAQTGSSQAQIAAAALRLQQAQAGQATTAARLGAAQALLQTQTRSLGASQALTAQQAAQMSFQLNDLFVQIASGGNPFIALLQQGSQLNGTFGGVGGTFRALAQVFTPLRLALGGAAAAVAALGAAFVIGEGQSVAFARAITLTGNAAGITEGQFNDMAASIAESSNTTIGSARETLQSLVASGRFSGEALNQAAQAVQTLSRATGQSREDIIRDFVRAADGPTRFAETTNRALNFLTAKQLEYIKTLEEQGRTQEALAATFTALNQRTTEAASNVGTLERAWIGAKNAVSGFVDAMLSIGRTKTTEDQIKSLRSELEAIGQIQSPEETGAGTDTRRAQIEAQIAGLEALQAAERGAAKASAEAAQQNQARIAFDKLREQTMTRQARLVKELADANAIADRAGATAAERAAVLAGIREKFAGVATDANKHVKAALAADLADIQEALKDRNEAVHSAQTVFAALQQAGQIDEETAFRNQRLRTRVKADSEIQALQDEIQRRSAARFVGKEAADLELQNATKIGEATREIERIRRSAAAADEALTIQQVANTRRRIAAQQQEQIAVSQAFEAVKRAHDLELSLFGAGDVERGRAQARAQIEEKFRADIERATNEIQSKRTAGTATADDERDFEARIVLLQSFLSRSLEEWDAYYAKRRAAEQDVSLGAAEAFRRYQDEAGNAARLAEGFFTNALHSLEDGLVQFVTTGKLNWKSLADSIIADITRIIIKQQIANALASGSSGGGLGGLVALFAGLFTGGGTAGNNPSAFVAGRRASGGPVQAGRLYEVNERDGPGEILNVGNRQYLLATQNGRVQPQQQAPAQQRGGNTYNATVVVSGKVDRGTRHQTANEVSRAQRAASRLT